jgi:hypothetical protein
MKPVVDKLELCKSTVFEIVASLILRLESSIIKEYMHLVPIFVWNSLPIDIFRVLDVGLECTTYITGKWID